MKKIKQTIIRMLKALLRNIVCFFCYAIIRSYYPALGMPPAPIADTLSDSTFWILFAIFYPIMYVDVILHE